MQLTCSYGANRTAEYFSAVEYPQVLYRKSQDVRPAFATISTIARFEGDQLTLSYSAHDLGNGVLTSLMSNAEAHS